MGYAEARVARLNPESEFYRPAGALAQALISATSIGSFVPSVKFVARFQGLLLPYMREPRGRWEAARGHGPNVESGLVAKCSAQFLSPIPRHPAAL